MPEPPKGSFFVARDHQAQSAVGEVAEEWVAEVARADFACHLQSPGLPEARSLGALAVAQESLIEKRDLCGCHGAASAGDARFAHIGEIEAAQRIFGDLRFRRLRHSRGLIIAGRRCVADVFDICEARVLAAWQTAAKIFQPQRQGDPLTDEVGVGLPGDPFNQFRHHIHARRWMVDKTRPGLPLQFPATKELETFFPVEKYIGRKGRVGKSGGMGEKLLDTHGLFAASSELGDQIRYRLVDIEPAFFDQHPCGSRCDRFGRREHTIEGVVGRRSCLALELRLPESVHGDELAVSRDGDLGRWQQTFVDLARSTLDQRGESFGVDPDGLGRHDGKTLLGHEETSPGLTLCEPRLGSNTIRNLLWLLR